MTMPSAATASVAYPETNFEMAAIETTVSAYCTADGKPTVRTSLMCLCARFSRAGERLTIVDRRFAATNRMKNSAAAVLEIAVAAPAPAAPTFRKRGRTKIASNTMLQIQPSETPKAAISANHSARTRFASRTFSTVPAPPMSTTHFAYPNANG